jgi:hypothetical protein
VEKEIASAILQSCLLTVGKKHVAKRFILVSNIVIFNIRHIRCHFLLIPLRGHLGHGDIHRRLFFEFFYISKYIENAFQIKGAYAPGSKSAMSYISQKMSQCILFNKIRVLPLLILFPGLS